jgi:hypothetical protein
MAMFFDSTNGYEVSNSSRGIEHIRILSALAYVGKGSVVSRSLILGIPPNIQQSG